MILFYYLAASWRVAREIEDERGGGGRKKGESERRRREVGEIERREGTLNRGLGSRRGGGKRLQY